MVNVHMSQRSKRPELIPVSLTWSMPRSIAIPPWTGCQAIEGLPPPGGGPAPEGVPPPPPPGSMSSVPIYKLEWRETKLSKLPCPMKQRDGPGLNLGPPDPEFEVLITTWPHTPPLPHSMLTSTCITEKPTREWASFDKGKFNVSECSTMFLFSFPDLSSV